MKPIALAAMAGLSLGAIVDPGAAIAASPFVKVGAPCGGPDNIYFCLTLTPDNKGLTDISSITVRFPGPGQAVVNWQGAAYCDVTPQTTGTSKTVRTNVEYFIHLGLKDDNSGYIYNAPGTATLGERFYQYTRIRISGARIAQFLTARRVDMKPVTLLRTYEIDRAKTVTYRSVGLADFRSFEGRAGCNINGGQMSVQFFPK